MKNMRYDITLNGKTFYHLFPPTKKQDPGFCGREWKWNCMGKGGSIVVFHNLKEVRAYATKLPI